MLGRKRARVYHVPVDGRVPTRVPVNQNISVELCSPTHSASIRRLSKCWNAARNKRGDVPALMELMSWGRGPHSLWHQGPGLLCDSNV